MRCFHRIGEERENKFDGVTRGNSSRFVDLADPNRSPLSFSSRSGRKRGTTSGESFRNRIATQRGSWKRGKRPVESERESRLRKRNCSAARRTLARNFPPGYRLPYPRWNRGPFERPVSSFSLENRSNFKSRQNSPIFNQISNEEIFIIKPVVWSRKPF